MGHAPGIEHAALPDRIEYGICIGYLLQEVRHVLGGAHILMMQIHADVRPWLDDGHALARKLRKSEKGVEFDFARHNLLQRRTDAPIKCAGVCKLVPARKRCRGDPVPQEIAKQRVHGLHC